MLSSGMRWHCQILLHQERRRYPPHPRPGCRRAAPKPPPWPGGNAINSVVRQSRSRMKAAPVRMIAMKERELRSGLRTALHAESEVPLSARMKSPRSSPGSSSAALSSTGAGQPVPAQRDPYDCAQSHALNLRAFAHATYLVSNESKVIENFRVGHPGQILAARP